MVDNDVIDYVLFPSSWLPVPKVVETAARVTAPVLIAPMRDILVSAGQPARLQCSVSGEGSDRRSRSLEHKLSPIVHVLVRGATYRDAEIKLELSVRRSADVLVPRQQRGPAVGRLQDVSVR